MYRSEHVDVLTYVCDFFTRLARAASAMYNSQEVYTIRDIIFFSTLHKYMFIRDLVEIQYFLERIHLILLRPKRTSRAAVPQAKMN